MIGKVKVTSSGYDPALGKSVKDPTLMSRAELEEIVRANPGITTPKLAELIGVSVTIARYMVHNAGTLEFYEGNHIRFK